MTFEAYAAFVKWYEQHHHEYVMTVLPLREDADKGTDSYYAYDEAYNEWLEDLHHAVDDWFFKPVVQTQEAS